MKTIGIYPGNFQPATKAHLEVYKRLKHIVGPDCFVVTTDRTPSPEAPLNFGDKEQIWVRHGIPISHVRKDENWKNPLSVFNDFSKAHTKVIFALNHKESIEISHRKTTLGQINKAKFLDPNSTSSKKDKNGSPDIKDKNGALNIKNKNGSPDIEDKNGSPDIEDKNGSPDIKNRFNNLDKNKEVWLDTKGGLNYFQPYKGNEHSMEPLLKHGYVLIVDDTSIEGKPISTTNIRQVLGSSRYDDNDKKKFFGFIFGWFDIGLYTLTTSKFKSAHLVLIPDEEDRVEMPSMSSLIRGKTRPIQTSPISIPRSLPNTKTTLQNMVREILGEIMDEEYSTDINEPNSTDDMKNVLAKQKTPDQQRSDFQKKKLDLIQQLKQQTLQSKEDKSKAASAGDIVKSYDRVKKTANKEKEKDIKQQIANPTPPII